MRVAIAVCVILMGTTSQADGQYKSIDDMKIEKVGMDMSRQDFLKLYPKARLKKNIEDEYGVKTYVLVDPSEESYSAFMFFDDNLLMMFVHWSQKGLSDVGGSEPIIKKILLKYGEGEYSELSKAKDGKGTAIVWITPESGMTILLDDNGLNVGLVSNKVTKQLKELKAKKAKSKIDE